MPDYVLRATAARVPVERTEVLNVHVACARVAPSSGNQETDAVRQAKGSSHFTSISESDSCVDLTIRHLHPIRSYYPQPRDARAVLPWVLQYTPVTPTVISQKFHPLILLVYNSLTGMLWTTALLVCCKP